MGAASGSPPAKRLMRNFLIDRRFQLGWVFKVALAATVIVGVMGYFLYGTLSESIELMKMEAMAADGLTPEAQTAILDQGDRDLISTGVVLASSLVGLVVLLSLLTIVATHRIAGPAYKMKKLFSDIDGDNLQLLAKLRKGDELHDVFEALDDMLRRIRESRHGDISTIGEVVEKLKKAESPDDAARILEKMRERFETSVKMH